jgi:hypothetical protein
MHFSDGTKDEYCLGYRTQVGALLNAQSPPPSPPMTATSTSTTTTTYLLMAAMAGGEDEDEDEKEKENRKLRHQRPTIRSTASVDDVQGLAQHLAEKFSTFVIIGFSSFFFLFGSLL